MRFISVLNAAAFGAVLGSHYGFTVGTVAILSAYAAVYVIVWLTLQAMFRRNE
jgi:hypothetical protein